jgi:2-dehydropantoate 2-reductase
VALAATLVRSFALAGEDVVFIARGDHLRAIKANGLRFETPSGETVIRTKASDNPIEVGNVDVVLVGVKAWQVTEAADAMRPLMGSDTVVVPLQNGVEAASELAAVLGSGTLGGMCGTLSFVAGPGHIRSVGGQNFIKFGELDNRLTERVERLRDCFANAKVLVEVPAEVPVCDSVWWCGLNHESTTWRDAGSPRDSKIVRAILTGSARGS